MKLYEINDQIRQLYETGFDEDTGEISEETSWALERLEMERTEKIEACAVVWKEYRAESDALAAEAKALTERKRVLDNRANNLRAYLASQLQNGEKIKTPRAALSWRKSQAVDVDELAFNWNRDDLIRVKKEADKTKIKAALEKGETVQGAQIVNTYKLQIK